MIHSEERAEAGFTFLELMTTVAVLSVVLGSIFMATLSTQNVFLQSQTVSQLNLRAQHTMNRIVEMAGQALTSDAQFSPLKPSTGINSHCLRFRQLTAYDPNAGQAVYDDQARIYVYGPDNGADPSSGLVIGRGPSLSDIHAAASGADGFLGSPDDDTLASVVNGLPAIELLMPSTFAPQAGEMFVVNVSPAPFGRLLTFTLRLNARGPDGSFLFPNDLVLTERVALRQ